MKLTYRLIARLLGERLDDLQLLMTRLKDGKVTTEELFAALSEISGKLAEVQKDINSYSNQVD